jgi:hypothetical protein
MFHGGGVWNEVRTICLLSPDDHITNKLFAEFKIMF